MVLVCLAVTLILAYAQAAPEPKVDLAIRGLAATFAASKLTGPLHVERGALTSVCAALNVSTGDCRHHKDHYATLAQAGQASDLAATVTYFVAPDGDDSASGTHQAPFRTPQRAQRALRKGRNTKIKASV